MTLRVLENFAGVGTQRMALKKLGIEHEVVGITEIDKYAIKSYEAIHGEVNNLGDISKVDVEDVPEHDLFTYSFPCQDISVAGKQSGFEKGSGTRSGLLWECERVIKHVKPKYLLMENVKNLVGKKFKPGFEEWLQALEDMGYTNYWQVLNAKDYGIPQNRERVFCVSILGEHEPYEFPKPVELELRLKDMLEDDVDDKFYLGKERIGQLKFKNSEKSNVIANGNHSPYNSTSAIYDIDKWSPTLAARDYKDPKRILVPKVEQVAQYDTPNRKNTNRFRTYDGEGISPTLTTMGGGGLQPHVRVEDNEDRYNFEDENGNKLEDIRIRKLTPRECWRLMGISDEDFDKAQAVNSNSRLYTQAGNAIVVDVLEAIFTNMFK